MTDSPKAQKDEVEEENNLDATPAAKPEDSEEVPEPVVESTEETKGEGKETGEKSKKKGYSQRVRQLNARAKKAEKKTKALEETLAELTTPVGPRFAPQTKRPQNEPIVKPGEEINVNELDSRIKAREQGILQQADARAELRQRQSEAITRISNETKDVVKAHPELDPDSDSFNKDLSESITEATEAYVRSNPYSASVKRFVNKLMKPYKGAVEKEVGKATENIAKQASQSALRPTSVKGGEKKFEELTEEEMEKKLGIVY